MVRNYRTEGSKSFPTPIAVLELSAGVRVWLSSTPKKGFEKQESLQEIGPSVSPGSAEPDLLPGKEAVFHDR